MSTINVTNLKQESSSTNSLVLTSGGDTQVIGALGLGGATYGTSGQVLTSAGSGSTPTWTTPTSLSNAEDGTGTNFEFNSGFGSNGVAYGVRAWVNYDGTTTTPSMRGNGNVSSISDGGIGRQTINFTTSMPDANYAVVAAPGDRRASTNVYTYNPAFYDFATSSFKVATFSDSTWDDYENVSVAVIR